MIGRSSALKIIGIFICISLIFTGSPGASSKSGSTSEAICDCSGDTYNCKDFPLPNGATGQDCFNYCKAQGKEDIHKLDRDNDGLVCEKK